MNMLQDLKIITRCGRLRFPRHWEQFSTLSSQREAENKLETDSNSLCLRRLDQHRLSII